MQKLPNVQSLAELLELNIGMGDRTALTDASTGRSVSFAELRAQAFDLARKLPHDISSGARVILYDLNPLDWVPLFFAITLRGWVVVPLDTRVSTEFFRSVEELTTPELIIVGDETQLESTYRTMRFSDLADRTGQRVNMVTPDPSAPAEILFTSGTWSRPKGVVLSQRNILTNAQQVLSVYQHTQEDVSLAVLPLSHAYQQTNGLFLPLLTGSEIVFLTSVSSEALTSAMRTYRVRTMLVVPRVLSLIESSLLRKVKARRIRNYLPTVVRAARFLPRILRRLIFARIHRQIGSTLTTLVVGGAPLSPQLDHFFQGLGYRVIVGYGTSECSPVITVSLNQRRQIGEVGRPLPNVGVEINEQGEVIVSGENVFLGYWPEISQPISFNTEDVGVIKDGQLMLKGRTKNLVVYPSGDKVFCEDVEYIANKISSIEDCCVVGVETASGIQLHCVIKGEQGLRVQEESIKHAINKSLPFGVRLEKVVSVSRDDFPYTHTLKPDRRRILELCVTSASTSLPN